jgi:hypothetical protein
MSSGSSFNDHDAKYWYEQFSDAARARNSYHRGRNMAVLFAVVLYIILIVYPLFTHTQVFSSDELENYRAKIYDEGYSDGYDAGFDAGVDGAETNGYTDALHDVLDDPSSCYDDLELKELRDTINAYLN